MAGTKDTQPYIPITYRHALLCVRFLRYHSYDRVGKLFPTFAITTRAFSSQLMPFIEHF